MVAAKLLRWAHLCAVGGLLVALSIAQFVILSVYRLFPKPLTDYVFWRSQQLQAWFSPRVGEDEQETDALSLIAQAGFAAEQHCFETDDGFVLVMHRLVPADGSRSRGPAVLVVHGLMQSSETFLCAGRRSLGVFLAERGFDVWLGNNRGNKYSHKHRSLSPASDAYWDYSIDELARFDVPAMVHGVLGLTGQQQLAYVGFSQGTAQAFAAFSLDPALAARVSFFGALAPAAKTHGISKSMLSSLVGAHPEFLTTLFGRRQMLGSVLLWDRILSHRLFARVCDISMGYLFRWACDNVTAGRKPALYRHVYSYCSVKCVRHWFQMVAADGELAMFEDEACAHRHRIRYNLRQVQCPIGLFVGGRDTVVDAECLIRQLPPSTFVHREAAYEHLDFLWADTVADEGGVYEVLAEKMSTPG